MRYSLSIILVLILLVGLSAACFAQDVLYIVSPMVVEMVEGQTYALGWSAGGAETVDIEILGTLTPLGTKSRGALKIQVARGISAVQNEYSCTLPWIDAVKFVIRITGRDGTGKQVSVSQKEYRFRPAVLANRKEDGIYVDLHQKVNQRLYVQKGGLVARAYIVSSSEKYSWLPATSHPKTPHDHAGVFKALDKNPSAYSRQYEVRMPWAMRYLSGHFIHATSPNFYRLLGGPASHGCNRLTKEDAQTLFKSTPVGTRVEIIGPSK